MGPGKHVRERQTRFATVPADKFVDGMTVGFLRTGCCERVKDRILRLLQVGKPKYCFRFGASCCLSMCHTGGLLRRVVSMVVQLKTYGIQARFWGRRSASNAADLPAKPTVPPFSV